MRASQYLLVVMLVSATNSQNHGGKRDFHPKVSAIRPVPFGYILREGFEDPTSNVKQPVDFIENTYYPRSAQEELNILEKPEPSKQIVFNSDVAIKLIQQRRERLFKELGIEIPQAEVPYITINYTDLLFDPDFQVMSAMNEHRRRNYNSQRSRMQQPRGSTNLRRIMNLNSFQPLQDICIGFKATDFNPKDVIDLEWVPFYVWGDQGISAEVHRFSYAPLKRVDEYRAIYTKHQAANPNIVINWNHPKMIMNTYSEYLLIAIDRKGLFSALHLPEVPPEQQNIMLPYTKIQINIAGPYIVLLYCNLLQGYLMSIAGYEPSTDADKRDAAAVVPIKLKGYPVTRDLEEENRRRMRQQEFLAERERRKYIKVVPPVPSVSQYDGYIP